MNTQVFYGEFYQQASRTGLSTVLSGLSLYIDKVADDFRQLENKGIFEKDVCEKVVENLCKLKNQVDACIDTAIKT